MHLDNLAADAETKSVCVSAAFCGEAAVNARANAVISMQPPSPMESAALTRTFTGPCEGDRRRLHTRTKSAVVILRLDASALQESIQLRHDVPDHLAQIRRHRTGDVRVLAGPPVEQPHHPSNRPLKNRKPSATRIAQSFNGSNCICPGITFREVRKS